MAMRHDTAAAYCDHFVQAIQLHILMRGATTTAWREFYEAELARQVELALAMAPQHLQFPDTPGDRKRVDPC